MHWTNYLPTVYFNTEVVVNIYIASSRREINKPTTVYFFDEPLSEPMASLSEDCY